MRLRRGNAWFANRVVQQHALTGVLFVGFALIWGASGMLLFCVQATLAIFTVELVQYCEHYGLLRDDGEQASANHAWNSNGWVTNAITLNITRHSEHHLAAHIPFQALRTIPGAPHTPMGYFGLAWLALWPKMWRHRIDPVRTRHQMITADRLNMPT
jgi:alkane 1-monooxygenase